MAFRSVIVVLVQQGASFGWDGVNCFHHSLYGAVFWICDVNSVGKTPMFYYFIADHCQSLLCFSLCPPSGRLVEGKELGHSWDSQPQNDQHSNKS